MSNRPKMTGTQKSATPSQQLETILLTPVPNDSTKRRNAVQELFVGLSDLEAHELRSQLQPNSRLLTLMNRRLSRRTVPGLLELLNDDKGASNSGTSSPTLYSTATQDKGINSPGDNYSARGVNNQTSQAITAPVPPPASSQLLAVRQDAFIQKGQLYTYNRLALTDNAEKNVKKYRDHLQQLLKSEDPAESLWASEEITLLDLAESYGILHGWALMFSFGNYNPKDIFHVGKFRRLVGKGGDDSLIEGSKWLPVGRDPNFDKTFHGVFRSKVFDRPEVMELIQGVDQYRAAFALGERKGMQSMSPSWVDSAFEALDVFGGMGDIADLAGIVAIFARAKRVAYVDGILHRAYEIPTATVHISKTRKLATSGQAVIRAMLGRSTRLLELIERAPQFRNRIINAIKNANPKLQFIFTAYQSHHIIPKSVIKKGAVFLEGIRRGLFDPDGIRNGLLLRLQTGKQAYTHPDYGALKNLPRHLGDHPEYNRYALKLQDQELSTLIGRSPAKMTIKQIADALDNVSDKRIKEAIERIQNELVRFLQTKAAQLSSGKLAISESKVPDSVATMSPKQQTNQQETGPSETRSGSALYT